MYRTWFKRIKTKYFVIAVSVIVIVDDFRLLLGVVGFVLGFFWGNEWYFGLFIMLFLLFLFV